MRIFAIRKTLKNVSGKTVKVGRNEIKDGETITTVFWKNFLGKGREEVELEKRPVEKKVVKKEEKKETKKKTSKKSK